jgi:hypothetical protein
MSASLSHRAWVHMSGGLLHAAPMPSTNASYRPCRSPPYPCQARTPVVFFHVKSKPLLLRHVPSQAPLLVDLAVTRVCITMRHRLSQLPPDRSPCLHVIWSHGCSHRSCGAAAPSSHVAAVGAPVIHPSSTADSPRRHHTNAWSPDPRFEAV